MIVLVFMMLLSLQMTPTKKTRPVARVAPIRRTAAPRPPPRVPSTVVTLPCGCRENLFSYLAEVAVFIRRQHAYRCILHNQVSEVAVEHQVLAERFMLFLTSDECRLRISELRVEDEVEAMTDSSEDLSPMEDSSSDY